MEFEQRMRRFAEAQRSIFQRKAKLPRFLLASLVGAGIIGTIYLVHIDAVARNSVMAQDLEETGGVDITPAKGLIVTRRPSSINMTAQEVIEAAKARINKEGGCQIDIIKPIVRVWRSNPSTGYGGLIKEEEYLITCK